MPFRIQYLTASEGWINAWDTVYQTKTEAEEYLKKYFDVYDEVKPDEFRVVELVTISV